MEDLLQTALNIQLQMQQKCYPIVQSLPKEEQLLINTRAIVHETIEVERELNWKHWKTAVPVEWENVKDEIVDQFIFLMNEINIVEMDAQELIDKTLTKISVNIERQKNGY